MKPDRTFLYRLATVLVIVGIGALMMIVGRGHTLYFDNKAVENTQYTALYRTDINVKGNDEQNLFARERGMATVMGQRAVVDVTYMREKGGAREDARFYIRLPYGLDGIVINVPALLAGAPADVYMSEFVSLAVETLPVDDVVITDEFDELLMD